jgi:hypothetical protein
MPFERTLPIKWEAWDTAGGMGEVQFYDVEFTQDFGVFKKGQKVKCLYVSYQEGVLKEYEGETVPRSMSVRLEPGLPYANN